MFVAMILDYYGGDQQIIDALKHDKVVLSVPPCCCCCCFILRPITLTEYVYFFSLFSTTSILSLKTDVADQDQITHGEV